MRLSRELLSESLVLVSTQDIAAVVCFIRVSSGPRHCGIRHLILVGMQDSAEVECFIRVFSGPLQYEFCHESFESLILVSIQDTAEVECLFSGPRHEWMTCRCP